jgi:pimeloyl-ACP methyl ester carboxylesterase
MSLELISIATDTDALDGLFYEPEGGATKGAVQLLHGNCRNFYSGPSRFLAPHLAKLGYAVLTYNRRGHDIMVTLKGRAPGGGAFQRIDEAVADNRYAADWLAARGYADPIVIGHSNGGMLAVQHVADHPKTPALVLLSAHCGGKEMMKIGSASGLLAGDQLVEYTEKAARMIDEGKGNEPMLMVGWWWAMTPYSFFDYMDRLPDVIELAPQIKCPTLYIRGTKEIPELYPAEGFAAKAGGPCDYWLPEGCDHYYTGHEPEVADYVSDWLKARGL